MKDPEYAKPGGNFTPRDVVVTVTEMLEKGSRDFDLTVNSILCCIAHRPDWALETVGLCKEFKDRGVVAIDIADADFTPGKNPNAGLLKQAFTEAYKNGIHRTVHAGEDGPVTEIKEALDHLYAERIGHGYKVLDDRTLYERCKEQRVHLEVCPISSVRTRSVPEDLLQHPLYRFVEDGVNFSINTDDPFVLDNNLSEDYAMVKGMGLTDEDIIKSIFNAARSSFATDSQKEAMIKELTEIYGDF